MHCSSSNCLENISPHPPTDITSETCFWSCVPLSGKKGEKHRCDVKDIIRGRVLSYDSQLPPRPKHHHSEVIPHLLLLSVLLLIIT